MSFIEALGVSSPRSPSEISILCLCLTTATRRGLLAPRSRSRPRPPQLVPQGATAQGTAEAVPGSAHQSRAEQGGVGRKRPRPGAMWVWQDLPHIAPPRAAAYNIAWHLKNHDAALGGARHGIAQLGDARIPSAIPGRPGFATGGKAKPGKDWPRKEMSHEARLGVAQPHAAGLCAPQSGGAPASPRGACHRPYPGKAE